jgi:hypothetical protein
MRFSESGPGVLWTVPQLPGAENVVLSDVWHFGVPSHAQTLEAISRELAPVGRGAAGATATVPPLEPAPDRNP